MSTTKSYRSAFIFLTSLFFLWGFITVLVDSLIPRLKEIFELSYFEAGLVQFNGCPDSDEDGIQDSEDLCPNKAGLIEFSGCPDTDGDGIQDSKDYCPTEAGPLENLGCPWADRDEDGIVDPEDACPGIPGPVENQGCPFEDSDGDGVFDLEDACPSTPGLPENNGCPKIEEEEQEVLNTAFENLEFVSGKNEIKESSFESLDRLAQLMEDKEEWKLRIAGHTDDQGRPYPREQPL